MNKWDQCRFKLKAVFCSYVCGFSYSNGFKNITKQNSFKSMILGFFKYTNGTILKYKHVSVDRDEYCKFGGLMNSEQF